MALPGREKRKVVEQEAEKAPVIYEMGEPTSSEELQPDDPSDTPPKEEEAKPKKPAIKEDDSPKTLRDEIDAMPDEMLESLEAELSANPIKPSKNTDIEIPADVLEAMEKLKSEDEGPAVQPGQIGTSFQKRDKLPPQIAARIKAYEVITLIGLGEIDSETMNNLAIAVDNSREVNIEDEDFSVRDELIIQMKIVKAVRSTILSPSGQLNKNTTINEVKSIMSSSMALLKEIKEANKDLLSMDRIKAMETSFLETVQRFPEPEQKEFVNLLERRMKAQEALKKEVE